MKFNEILLIIVYVTSKIKRWSSEAYSSGFSTLTSQVFDGLEDLEDLGFTMWEPRTYPDVKYPCHESIEVCQVLIHEIYGVMVFPGISLEDFFLFGGKWA